MTQTHSTTRYDIVTTLKQQKNLRRRPLAAALRGFRIEVTDYNMFTPISSKTCIEHIHKFSHTIPSMVCVRLPPSEKYTCYTVFC